MQPVPMPARISDSQNVTAALDQLFGGRYAGFAETAGLEPLAPEDGRRHAPRLTLALDHRAVGAVIALPAWQGEKRCGSAALAAPGRLAVRGREGRRVGPA